MGRRLRHRHGKKKPDLFASLPSEITIDILSRLPIRTIGICKTVCKSWLNLLGSRQFADFHLPKSATGLVICDGDEGSPSNNYKVFEFDDDERIAQKYSPLTEFNSLKFTEHSSVIQGSVDGLILYRAIGSINNDLYICNPITHEYINLPQSRHGHGSAIVAIGFGVSKISRQHKVVTVLQSGNSKGITKSRCFVYVLGAGKWKRVAPPVLLYDNNTSYSIGTPLNGNLHWLIKLGEKSNCISCFDLEKETFTTFSLRPLALSRYSVVTLVVLGDLLSVCQNHGNEIFIWSMKEYGDEKSWSKEFVIEKDSDFEPRVCCGGRLCNVLYPLKVFRDGDILMAYKDKHMVRYSDENRTIAPTGIFGLGKKCYYEDDYELWYGGKGGMEAMLHTSSLLSLRSFEKEKDSVRLF